MRKNEEKYGAELPNEILHITVQRLNPDTREVIETEVDEDYAGFMMLADNVGRKSFQELIMFDNDMNIARKMAQSSKTSSCLQLATIMKGMYDAKKREEKDDKMGGLEDLLASLIGGETGGDEPC